MDAHAEIARAIDNYRDKAVALSHEIHEHPELKFQEHFAAGLLTKAATELGLEVEREVGGLKTAFRAEFGGKRSGGRNPRRIRRAAQRSFMRPQPDRRRRAQRRRGFEEHREPTTGASRFSRHAGRGRRRRKDNPDRQGRVARRRCGHDGASDRRGILHDAGARHAASQADVSWPRRARGDGAMGRLERTGRGDPDLPERRCDAAAPARRLAHPRHHHRRRPGG